MSVSAPDIVGGIVLPGSQFSEPMRVIGNPTAGDGFVLVNLVGTRTSTFRGGLTLTNVDLCSIQIERKEAVFGGKPRLFKLGLEALRISLAQEYLLTAARAKALKQGITQPPATPSVQPPTQPTPAQPPVTPGTPPTAPPETPATPNTTTVVWEGELKREQWNLFSLKVLTRLADKVEIKVKVQATLKEGQTTEPLNAALKELRIQEGFHKT